MVTTRSGLSTNSSVDRPEKKGRKGKAQPDRVKTLNNNNKKSKKLQNAKLEKIVESCKVELTKETKSDETFNKLDISMGLNLMDVTSSVSEYDMTVNPEQVDLEEKEYRKDKKIPAWAKNGPALHFNLFLQQPDLINLMSTKCFPGKSTMKLKLL